MRTLSLRSLAVSLGVAVLAAATGCFAGGPNGAGPRDFNFKDESLAAIFSSLGEAGGFSVVVAPEISRAKMVVSLKQVEPLDALFLVSKIQALRVRRDPAAFQNGITRYVISRPEKVEKCYQIANSRTVQLQRCRAAEARDAVLKRLGKNANIGIEIDARTNRMLLRADEDLLSKAMTIVSEVESAAPCPLPSANGRASLAPGFPSEDPLAGEDLDLTGF